MSHLVLIAVQNLTDCILDSGLHHKQPRCPMLKTLLSLMIFYLPYISLRSKIMSPLLSYGQPSLFHDTMK